MTKYRLKYLKTGTGNMEEKFFLPMFTRTPGKSGSFKYIDIDAIDNKQHKITVPKKIEAIKAPSRSSRGVDTGDVLFSLVRPYLENIALIKEEHETICHHIQFDYTPHRYS